MEYAVICIRPSNSSSQSTHDIQTNPANRTPSIRVTALKRLVSFYLSDVPCCFSPGRPVCCFACVSACIVVGGRPNPCLLHLSSRCFQWLTRDNHVLFSRVVFLGRHVGLCPSLSEAVLALAFCLSDQVWHFPASIFWSRRRFLNVCKTWNKRLKHD